MQKPFILPEASRYVSAVVAYLQDQGIDPELIGTCIQAGILYESQKYQNCNCVFMGKDIEGRARFACMLGPRDSFRMDIEGIERLEQAIREDSELSQRVALIYRNPPSKEHGKDYNEFLCDQIRMMQKHKNRNRSIQKQP